MENDQEFRKDRELAEIIKNTHKSLRQKIKNSKEDENQIWIEHVDDIFQKDSKDYAIAMKQLSDEFWANETRLDWLSNHLNLYFIEQDFQRFLKRINRKQGNEKPLDYQKFDEISKFDILDVGSCHNPLLKYLKNSEKFSVMAIDLSPACESVIRGDFIQVPLNDNNHKIADNNLMCLKRNSFDAVIFCLLLGIFKNLN